MEQPASQPTRGQKKEMKEYIKKQKRRGVFAWERRPFRDVACPSLCALFPCACNVAARIRYVVLEKKIGTVAGIAAVAYQLILCKGDSTHALLVLLGIHRLMESAH